MVKQRSGLTDISYAQIASKIFIPEEKMDTPLGNAISALVNNVNASTSGIALTYLLTLTGRDKSIIKGISFGSVLWIVVNGLISSIGLDLKSKRPLTHVLSWLDHAIFGALCACLIPDLEVTISSRTGIFGSRKKSRCSTSPKVNVIGVVDTIGIADFKGFLFGKLVLCLST